MAPGRERGAQPRSARAYRPRSPRAAPSAPEPVGDEVHDAVAALPERQRLAVFLRYYADLDYRAIGEVLGVTDGTARERPRRAMRHCDDIWRWRCEHAGSSGDSRPTAASGRTCSPGRRHPAVGHGGMRLWSRLSPSPSAHRPHWRSSRSRTRSVGGRPRRAAARRRAARNRRRLRHVRGDGAAGVAQAERPGPGSLRFIPTNHRVLRTGTVTFVWSNFAGRRPRLVGPRAPGERHRGHDPLRSLWREDRRQVADRAPPRRCTVQRPASVEVVAGPQTLRGRSCCDRYAAEAAEQAAHTPLTSTLCAVTRKP